MERKQIRQPIRNDPNLALLRGLEDAEAEKKGEYEELQNVYFMGIGVDEEMRNHFPKQVLNSEYQRIEYWDSIAKIVYTPGQPTANICGKPLMGSKVKPGEKSVVEAYPAFFTEPECLDDVLSAIDHEAVHCYVVHRKKPVVIGFPPIKKVETEEEKKVWDTTLEVMAYAGSVLEIKNKRRNVSERYKRCSLSNVGRRFLNEIGGYARRSDEIGAWAKNSLEILRKMQLIVIV